MSSVHISLVSVKQPSIDFLSANRVNQQEVSDPGFQNPDSFTASLSTGGKRGVVVSSRGKLFLLDAEKQQVKRIPDLEQGMKEEFPPSFSPDGNSFAFTDSRDHIVLACMQNGETLWRKPVRIPLPTGFERNEEIRSAPSFSPDGKQIVAGTASGKLVFLDRQTGEKVREFASGLEHASSLPVFSPDGKQIAATFWNGSDSRHHLLSFDSCSGKILWNEVTYYGGPVPLSFSPDGSKIAVGSGWGTDEGMIGLRDASNGRLLWEKKMPMRIGSSPLFSPDGKRLYVPLWSRKLEMALLNVENGDEILDDSSAGECNWQPSPPVPAGPRVRVVAMTGEAEKKSLGVELYEFPAYASSSYVNERAEIRVDGGVSLGGVAV